MPECFRSEARQRSDFLRASPCGLGFCARLRKQLRRHERRREKCDEHHPVECLSDGERPVWRLEEIIDQYRTHHGERVSQWTATAGAAAEHDEQQRQRGVRLLDLAAHADQRRRTQGKHRCPKDPGTDATGEPLIDAAHGSSRYPTPGSVMMIRGSAGFSSILRRRCVT
jgi:hypothetical protein